MKNKAFHFRLEEDTLERLNALATKTRRSRGQVVRLLLEWALDQAETKHGRDSMNL